MKTLLITFCLALTSFSVNAQPSWELQSPIPSNQVQQQDNSDRPDSPSSAGDRDDPPTIPLSGFSVLVILSGVFGAAFIIKASGKSLTNAK